MGYLGHKKVGDTLTITWRTKTSAGVPVNADAAPTYAIYEQSGDTVLVSGTGSLHPGRTGWYAVDVTLGSGSGFEENKDYRIVKTAVIAGDTFEAEDRFNVGPTSPIETYVPPAGVSGTSPITTVNVRSHLVGLHTWLDVAAKSQARYDNARIERAIGQRIRRFERENQFRINAVQVVSRRDDTYASEGSILDVTDTYEVIDDVPYTYYHQDAWEFFRLHLHERPIRTVQRARVYADSTRLAFDIPSGWYRWDWMSGKFFLVPQSGVAITSQAWVGLAPLTMGFGRDHVPLAVEMDYIAGLPANWYAMNEWSDLLLCLEEYAALQVLNDISQLYDAGLLTAAIHAEGIQQQMNYSRFQDRKQELNLSTASLAQIFKDQINGISVEFI